MKVLDEVPQDKDLMVPNKAKIEKQPRKKIHEVIDKDYFKQSYVVFPKEFI